MGIRFRTGNLLESDAQTLVNTVNCVGIMGKGIALEFRKRYPAMFERYVVLCKSGEVRLGRPYLDRLADRMIINFPTKGHWKSRSSINDVRAGLRYLKRHLTEWGVSSIAIPPLGCGYGGLQWEDVRPLIVDELSDLPIDIQVYEPGALDATVSSIERVNPQMSLFTE